MLPSASFTIDKRLLRVFYATCGTFLVSLLAAAYTEERFILLAPFLIIGAIITIVDYRLLFYFLVMCLPFSFSVYLGANAFAELPTEPLMILFMIIIIFRPWVVKNYDVAFNHHPLSLLLILQLLWLIPVTLNSTDILLSLKYLVSKYWYLATFFYGVGIFVKTFGDWKKLFWYLYWPILIVSLIISVRHALHGFEFYYASIVDRPFFDNHVIYGCYVAMIIPYVFYARKWYPRGSFKRKLLNASVIYFVFAVFTSYTRATWLSLVILIAVYYLIRWRAVKGVLITLLLLLTIGVSYLLYNNKYIDYAPHYETTIFHKGDIAGHLQATYTMKDVSGMERVYRWVAAKNMILARPWLGVGTNCFYDNYTHYTVRAFETYVSDNPEKSTTHNYFIMVFTEQGLPGFALFVVLCLAVYWIAQRLYRQIRDREYREFMLATVLSLTVLIFHLFLNDLIETDKLGTLFYMGLALLVRVDLWRKKLPS